MDVKIDLERQRARVIAEEYRGRGYEVVELPSPQELPDFLSGYNPDFLARKGDETVVVEVKCRSSLAKDPRTRTLAQLLQGKPGWRFELVVVEEGEKLGVPEGARPLERQDILLGIESAERLLESGFSEAALMLAWSASEATVRLLAKEDNISIDRPASLYVLKHAVTEGLISRNDYNFLVNTLMYRNALAHGFKTMGFDSGLVYDLISTTKHLLQSTATP